MKVSVPKLLAELGIEARQRGTRWHARCPAHDDRKPSWAILDDPEDRKHARSRCLSCGFSGDAIELVRVVLGLATRHVAREWVEENALDTTAHGLRSVAVERADPEKPAFAMPAGVVEIDDPARYEGKPGAYLRGRGVPYWQARRWRLGYALDGKLRGRVVFPIRDWRGKLLSYTGRTFTKSPVRYKNPSRAEGPDPGAIFGEVRWPAIGARRALYLAEGALKVLAVERVLSRILVSGIVEMPEGTGIGAAGGSGLVIQQAVKLATWPRIILVADRDPAGRKYAEEIVTTLRRSSEVEVVFTPPKRDADDLEPGELRALLGIPDTGIRDETMAREDRA